MKRATIVSIIFFVLVSLISATVIFTQPASLADAFQLYLANLLLHVCGGVLFLLAIKGFRESLKPAYRLLSAGASMLVGGVLVIYVLDALKASKQPWAAGVTEFPFILMAVFFYIGICMFAKLIWAKSWLTKGQIIFPIALVAGALAGFIPGLLPGDASYEYVVSIRFFNLILFAATAALAFKVWRVTSPLYRPAFGWFNAFCSLTVFNTVCGFLQELSWMRWFSQVSILLYAVTGFLLYMTALRFNQLAYAEKNSKLVQKQLGSQAKSSVDIVTFLAQFASIPSAIDPILDPVRRITSSTQYKRQLSEAQQAVLAKTYLDLETYLISKETVRKFKKDDLRQMIELQFKGSVNEPAFWARIQPQASK